jgi:hypothetical protein
MAPILFADHSGINGLTTRFPLSARALIRAATHARSGGTSVNRDNARTPRNFGFHDSLIGIALIQKDGQPGQIHVTPQEAKS